MSLPADVVALLRAEAPALLEPAPPEPAAPPDRVRVSVHVSLPEAEGGAFDQEYDFPGVDWLNALAVVRDRILELADFRERDPYATHSLGHVNHPLRWFAFRSERHRGWGYDSARDLSLVPEHEIRRVRRIAQRAQRNALEIDILAARNGLERLGVDWRRKRKAKP